VANQSIFAVNLRQACLRYRTISEVCDGIGINRQQFNKYLSGTSMPNALTLERICRFLGVRQSDLFEQSGFREDQTQLIGRPEGEPFSFLCAGDRDFDISVNDLRNGNYFCYTPLNVMPGIVVRGLLRIRRVGGKVEFVRLSVFTTAKASRQPFARGRHAGTVFANAQEIYLLGRNRYEPRQLSMMTIDKANSFNRKIYTGILTTRTSNMLSAMRFCLVYLDDQAVSRKLISELQLIHELDTDLGPDMFSMLKAPV
jgi:transcriptional regulator with XRE-family HTH domain